MSLFRIALPQRERERRTEKKVDTANLIRIHYCIWKLYMLKTFPENHNRKKNY